LSNQAPADLSIPASPRRRYAYQAGYAARLQSRGLGALPYEQRGWAAALAVSWLDGWRAADSLVEGSAYDWVKPFRRRSK